MSYTSGTTGRPKGAEITHLAFDRFFMMSSLEPTEAWTSDDVLWMVMPNFHLAGTWVSLSALYHGAMVIGRPLHDQLRVEAVWGYALCASSATAFEARQQRFLDKPTPDATAGPRLPSSRRSGFDRGWHVEPAVFRQPGQEGHHDHEEIFGPVLAVIVMGCSCSCGRPRRYGRDGARLPAFV
jgi:hypothetical protein